MTRAKEQFGRRCVINTDQIAILGPNLADIALICQK
jgi:hypothetical protein